MTRFPTPGAVRLATTICGAILALGHSLLASDTDWPQFRGPTGNGLSTSTDLALTWDENTH